MINDQSSEQTFNAVALISERYEMKSVEGIIRYGRFYLNQTAFNTAWGAI